MNPDDLNSTGTYKLILELPVRHEIGIGALGPMRFQRGVYVYVGSAFGPGGLKARLRHHLFTQAPPRWHIDYLRKHAEVLEIRFTVDKYRHECSWAEKLSGLPGSSQPAPGFGASDCRCFSHLFRIRERLPTGMFGEHTSVFHRKDFGCIR